MERLARINEIESRLEVIEAKGEKISAEEITEVRTLVTELETLEAEQEALVKMRSRKHDQIKRSQKTPEQKLQERFSFFKVVRELKEGKKFTGAELEMHQIGLEQARESNNLGISGFALPTLKPAQIEERTTLTAGVAATAGNLIATNLYDFVPALAPMVKLLGLGANLMTNLVGNIDIPAGNAIATATFNTEQGDAAETNPTIKKVTMTPKRLAAWTEMSLQMLAQSSINLENYVTSQLIGAEARALDRVGLNGGATNEPVGILSLSGTNLVAIDTNGGAITRAKLIEMMTKLADENADEGTMAFLSTPGVKGYLMNQISSAGVGPFIWQDNNTILGIRAETSNLLPKNLVKGSSGAVCHPVIHGDFSKLLIGNWGVRDVTIDNVTRIIQGGVRVVINSFWDVQCVHPKQFSVIKDALI